MSLFVNKGDKRKLGGKFWQSKSSIKYLLVYLRHEWKSIIPSRFLILRRHSSKVMSNNFYFKSHIILEAKMTKAFALHMTRSQISITLSIVKLTIVKKLLANAFINQLTAYYSGSNPIFTKYRPSSGSYQLISHRRTQYHSSSHYSPPIPKLSYIFSTTFLFRPYFKAIPAIASIP